MNDTFEEFKKRCLENATRIPIQYDGKIQWLSEIDDDGQSMFIEEWWDRKTQMTKKEKKDRETDLYIEEEFE